MKVLAAATVILTGLILLSAMPVVAQAQTSEAVMLTLD